MRARYAKGNNAKRINELLEKGLRLYTAIPGKMGEPITLVFVEERNKEKNEV